MAENIGFFPIPITNPAELATLRADEVAFGPRDQITPQDNRIVAELDDISTIVGFDGRYQFRTNLALTIPIEWPEGEPVPIHYDADRQVIDGELATYSVIMIGGLAVAGAEEKLNIKALCLTFGEATKYPSFDTVPKNHLLHIPAYAVTDLRKAA